MQISRKKHWQFLEDELKAETEEFKKTYFWIDKVDSFVNVVLGLLVALILVL